MRKLYTHLFAIISLSMLCFAVQACDVTSGPKMLSKHIGFDLGHMISASVMPAKKQFSASNDISNEFGIIYKTQLALLKYTAKRKKYLDTRLRRIPINYYVLSYTRIIRV